MSEPAAHHVPPPFDFDHPTIESVAALLESGHPVHADLQLRRIDDASGSPAKKAGLMLQVAGARHDPVRTVHATDSILAATPNRPDLRLGRARANYVLGRLEDAAEDIRSVQLPPRHPRRDQIRWWHARILIRAGRLEEAAEIAETLSRSPGMAAEAAVQRGEIELLGGDLPAARDRLDSISRDDRASIPARFDASFLLARVLDGLGDHEGAFAAAARGNRMHPNDFDPGTWDRATDAIIKSFDPRRMRDATRSETHDQSPVLLVGMPRSGTSLLEQILASHPRAGGVGERREPFLIEEDVTALDAIREQGATSGDLDLEARLYLDMQKAMGIEQDRIVNKVLGVDRVLGTIARVLPSCRIIHLERNPRDTILSIHQHGLNGRKYPWSRELEHITRALAAHERLMNHWKRVLATPILTVSHEAIVSDPRGQIERITSFLGIDFDDACLRFHESDRTVITPSHDQIRVPLNARGIGRWRRYERHLGTVLKTHPVDSGDPDARELGRG